MLPGRRRKDDWRAGCNGSHIRVHHPNFRYSLTQNRNFRKGCRPHSGYLLSREKSKSDQLSPLVLQCFRTRPATQCLCPPGCWYHARAHVDLPSLEGIRINSNVGGACGEIVALKGKYGVNLLNPLVAAQSFEYKISSTNLLRVFLGILLSSQVLSPPIATSPSRMRSQMYLAEDRILCWELVSKRGCSWILHHVKSAYGVTYVPDQYQN
jgi:hypothetical protein